LPVIEALAEEFQGRARVVKVEADRDGVVLDAFDASSIPAYLVFRDGVQVDRIQMSFLPWFLESRIRAMVESALE
jgi:thioredoxin-like negative regulator of GroEL